MKTFFDDSWVIHFYSRKEYGFVLVLYRFLDISSFTSEKGNTAKLSPTGFIYKQNR